METRQTQTVNHELDFASLTSTAADQSLASRLDTLLALNAATEREKTMFASEREKLEASFIKNPLTVEKTYSLFGLLLGIFPPAAFFAKIVFADGFVRHEQFWFLGVLAVVNLITAIVGYFSGKFIGRIITKLEESSWTAMLLALPFVGILWGLMAGSAGGAVIFLIGAIFGAAFGAAVGCFALPVFTIFHRWLKKGDVIDQKHFLPLAFGITFIVCAFILGL